MIGSLKMPTTSEDILADISTASAAGFRGQLIARGQARAMIWKDGELPPEAPKFDPKLSHDLRSYGYSLLGVGLRLREMDGNHNEARIAFEQAATALESVISKGALGEIDRGFHFVMAAVSYHLAHLSARAFSLLSIVTDNGNFSLMEKSLSLLIRRDFNAIEKLIFDFRISGLGSDQKITADLQHSIDQYEKDQEQPGDSDEYWLSGLDLALTDGFFAAIAEFLLAVERGDAQLSDNSINRLREGLSICSELNLVPQWWTYRAAIHLLSDLWTNTFHQRLPIFPAGGEAEDWPNLRRLFIASLQRRFRAEIDLWPSQVLTASRAADQSDNLVVSLPTSAGKTRIAELCILRCLAAGKNIVFVTPLRALSAQTETTLQRTFGPLGKSISALYGSIGMNAYDEDVIRSQDIVVATPEKLDFALRNDPSLLDDVGLLVFDEGHMIGLNEREIRYEVQIQRLLKRADAQERRIVCLSAILPEGEQLEDFAAWLRQDQDGDVVKSKWSPTRLRFGEIIWNEPYAQLNLQVGDERPWVKKYFEGFVPPIGQRRVAFPRDQRELCLATAWRLVEDGQTVLIYCPMRRSVEGYADVIVDLHKRGALRSLLEVDVAKLASALSLGKEWLGEDSAILKCLKLGIALHHGALPTAFRKEVERLLSEGVLSVTISSPTLAQGLNLSATAVVMHSLHRNREIIKSSEFRNVVGRAGRAHVDIEGLALFPMFENIYTKRNYWERLISDLSQKDMESGLALLVLTLLSRMASRVGGDSAALLEYITNNAEIWAFPEVENEDPKVRERAITDWENNLASLDSAILSLLGEKDIPDDEVETALDSILQSSLWHRRLLRKNEHIQQLLKTGLNSRSHWIWSNSTLEQRKGYFLAGVGLATGHALDAISTEVNDLLVAANAAIIEGNTEGAISSITDLAEKAFWIKPFTPDPWPENWKEILRYWLNGDPLTDIPNGDPDETLRFVEGGLIYHLPWAMEAIRVRAVENQETVGVLALPIDSYELGLAVSAVETGTLNGAVSILIKAGFGSRLAAIKVVSDTAATFTSSQELKDWLRSAVTIAWGERPNWPTAETKQMWMKFVANFAPTTEVTWAERRYEVDVRWNSMAPTYAMPVRVCIWGGKNLVLSADGTELGTLLSTFNPEKLGLIQASVSQELGKVDIIYLGPDDLWL